MDEIPVAPSPPRDKTLQTEFRVGVQQDVRFREHVHPIKITGQPVVDAKHQQPQHQGNQPVRPPARPRTFLRPAGFIVHCHSLSIHFWIELCLIAIHLLRSVEKLEGTY